MVDAVRHERAQQHRRRCDSCRALLQAQGRGRPARFCGSACRSAAYRRRRRGVAETLPRWVASRGRLTLSSARTWRARQALLKRRRMERRAAAVRARCGRATEEGALAARKRLLEGPGYRFHRAYQVRQPSSLPRVGTNCANGVDGTNGAHGARSAIGAMSSGGARACHVGRE